MDGFTRTIPEVINGYSLSRKRTGTSGESSSKELVYDNTVINMDDGDTVTNMDKIVCAVNSFSPYRLSSSSLRPGKVGKVFQTNKSLIIFNKD